MFSDARTILYLRILLISVYFVNGLLLISQNSVTYDEGDHFSYAIRIFKGHPEKTRPYDDASAMPVSVLNAIPRAVEQLLHPGLVKTDWGASDIINGRYITLLVCLLTGLYISRWATQLYGEKAGLLSFFLFVFCPDLNAHGTLFTTDAYAALFTVSTLYYFWLFVKTGGWKHLVWLAISLGAAQLTKQSLTHLVLIVMLLSLIIVIKRKIFFLHFKKNLLKGFIVIAIMCLVMNAGFLFNETGKSLGSYQFSSHFFSNLQSSFSFIKNVPLLLPSPYVEGLDLTMRMDEIGPGDPRVSGYAYMLGEWKKGEGFWYYYFVVLFFKTPLVVLAGLTWLAILFMKKRGKEWNPENEFILSFPVLYFLVYFNFFVNTQAGIRHILFIFPLFYVAIGKVSTIKLKWKGSNWIFAALLVFSVFSFYRFFPNLISYTNEFVADKKNVYKIMADSNIDFGQGNFWLQKYLARHSEARKPSTKPQAGIFIIGINDFLDLNEKHEHDWLKHFTPTAHFKYCYLVFEISELELQQKGFISK